MLSILRLITYPDYNQAIWVGYKNLKIQYKVVRLLTSYAKTQRTD